MTPKRLTTLATYVRTQFTGDLIAGMTVAMVALPLSLAIAIASGAGPEKGIVTAIVAGLLISLFGGSRVKIGGPTGAFIVVVFGVIAKQRYDGLVLATFMAGFIMLVALQLDTNFSRFGALLNTLPVPALPEISLARIIALLPSALAIAFLASIESLLSAMVADKMVGGNHRPNAEVRAQGLATIGFALFGGLPATGAIARTATNVRAGGKTPVAGLARALTVLLVMLLAAPLAGYLAMVALAFLSV